MAELSQDQMNAIHQMHNGCILCGDVGSGKSRTALGYYLFKVCQGSVPLMVDNQRADNYKEMKYPRDLFIITTAKKRDSGEWEKECYDYSLDDSGIFPVSVKVDSWNNIKKYKDVYSSFFIFDEQRVVGSGEWVKTFLNITRKNQWVLLSATPGDIWTDYIPVFVANGFYKNKSEFTRKHCIYRPFSNYPQIDRFVGIRELERHRESILVPLKDRRHTIRNKIDIWVSYDKELYKTVWRDRWNPYDDEPIQETGKLCYLLRRVTNSHPERIAQVDEILQKHDKIIIFYNHNYELEILIDYLSMRSDTFSFAQWNGKKHEDIPNTNKWVYLVQYRAGSEGWNCIETNCIIFYSQEYSYRITEQACGRIDRVNTPYKNLYYYYIRSRSPIDMAIYKTLLEKREFNERKFIKERL